MSTALAFTTSLHTGRNLRQALASSRITTNLVITKTAFQFLERCLKEETLRWIFIEGEIDDPMTRDLVKDIRSIEHLDHVPVVLVSKLFRSAAPVRHYHFVGQARIDGIILQPFSVETLSEVVELASKRASLQEFQLWLKPLELLVDQIVSLISDTSSLLEKRQPARVSRLVLQDMGSALKELPETLFSEYFRLLDIRCKISTPRKKSKKVEAAVSASQEIAPKIIGKIRNSNR